MSRARCHLVTNVLSCWQYTQGGEGMPLWALPHVSGEEDEDVVKVKFHAQDGSDCMMDVGDWLVQMPGGTVCLFDNEEFTEYFKFKAT